MKLTNRTFGLAAASLLALSLAACGSNDGGATTDTDTAETNAESNAQEVFDVEDPWVKATEGMDMEDHDHDHADGDDHDGHDHGDMGHGGMMTGAFGLFTNTTGDDVTITGLTTDVAPHTELHEVVDVDGESMMREVDGGFTVAAGETLTLEPGGLHFMLMQMEEDINIGDEVEMTIELESGETQTVVFTAKEFVGANESYADIEE